MGYGMIKPILTFKYKARWIWYFFWSWTVLSLIITFFLIDDYREYLQAFREVDLPNLLKYNVWLFMDLYIIHQCLFLKLGSYTVRIYEDYLLVEKNYRFYTFKKRYEVDEITEVNTLYNVSSEHYIRLFRFPFSWKLDAPQKDVVGIQYRGSLKKIGLGAGEFKAKPVIQAINRQIPEAK
jgi:hypothetical protein